MNGLIPDRTFFRIGDVARILELKTHVIRFWEGQFPFVVPVKGPNGQRVYRRSQIESLILVKHLLHVERYSIEGAKKRIAELRKSGNLKEMMKELSTSSSSGNSEAPLGPGSLIPKNRIESLESKIEELQNLIRDPKSAGLDVPGLKSF
ncbi:MAG: MerR family transcriptional regulator [Bdellovibrionales bacterium]|nr:MerR family transcriptional regulator [Bdellovibrionales bacterium]